MGSDERALQSCLLSSPLLGRRWHALRRQWILFYSCLHCIASLCVGQSHEASSLACQHKLKFMFREDFSPPACADLLDTKKSRLCSFQLPVQRTWMFEASQPCPTSSHASSRPRHVLKLHDTSITYHILTRALTMNRSNTITAHFQLVRRSFIKSPYPPPRSPSIELFSWARSMPGESRIHTNNYSTAKGRI